MNSLAYIPASDGAANASLMTVTNVRSSGATTIQVNTVANVPTKFYASYGTPHTFTDPVTGETITVISEATAVDFAGHIDGSNVEIDEIAPGYTDQGNEVGDIIVIRPVTEWANNVFNLLSVAHNDDGSLKADSVDTAAIQDEAVTTAKLADGAVTSEKRSGGFYMTNHSFSTTGSHSVTGFGFKPKYIKLTGNRSATGSSDSFSVSTEGSAYDTGSGIFQAGYCFLANTSNHVSRRSTTSAMLGLHTNGNIQMQASITSFDADGITVNVATASPSWDSWLIEAFG